MKLLRAFMAVLAVSTLYYLAGAFITGTFDSTQWDGFGKLLTVICAWLPASVIAAALAADVRIGP